MTNKQKAGRKPMEPELKKVQVGLRMDPEIKHWLDCQPEPNIQIIESALRKEIRRRP